MLSTSQVGREIREALKQGVFRYDPDSNEMRDRQSGDRYFHTDRNNLYRWVESEKLEVYDPAQQAYKEVDALWENERLVLQPDDRKHGKTTAGRNWRWTEFEQLELLQPQRQEFDKVAGLQPGERRDYTRKFGVPQLAPGLLEEVEAYRRHAYFTRYPSQCGEEPARDDARWAAWKLAKDAEEAEFERWSRWFDAGA